MQRLPPEMAHNPTEPHLAWLEKMLPRLAERLPDTDTELGRPLECMQKEGDIIHVPEGAVRRVHAPKFSCHHHTETGCWITGKCEK